MAKEKKEIEFSTEEKAVLSKLYDVANGSYNTHMLAMALNPELKPGTEEAGKAYFATRDSIERLIYLDLVDGERVRGNDGVYFSDLKLTKKGQRTAIAIRRNFAVPE